RLVPRAPTLSPSPPLSRSRSCSAGSAPDGDSNPLAAVLSRQMCRAGYTRVVALDAASGLLSQKAFTFGVQELFDLVHLSGLDVRSEEHTSELHSRFDLVCG